MGVEKIKVKDVKIGDTISLNEFNTPAFKVVSIEKDKRILFFKAWFLLVTNAAGHQVGQKLGVNRTIKRLIP